MSNRKEDFSQVSEVVSFFTQEQAKRPPEARKTTQAAKQENKEEQHFSFALNNKKEERKSQRVQLLVKPSVVKKIKEIAESNGVSMNDLVNQLLEAFCNYTQKGAEEK